MRAKQLNTDRLAWRWYANRSVLFLFLRHMYLPYGIFYIRRGFSHRNQHFFKTRGREVRKWLYSVLKNKRLHGCVQLSSAGYVVGTESEGFFIPHTIPAGELGLYHERPCTYLRGRHWQHQQQCPRSGGAWLPYRHKEQRERFRNFFITKWE